MCKIESIKKIRKNSWLGLTIVLLLSSCSDVNISKLSKHEYYFYSYFSNSDNCKKIEIFDSVFMQLDTMKIEVNYKNGMMYSVYDSTFKYLNNGDYNLYFWMVDKLEKISKRKGHYVDREYGDYTPLERKIRINNCFCYFKYMNKPSIEQVGFYILDKDSIELTTKEWRKALGCNKN